MEINWYNEWLKGEKSWNSLINDNPQDVNFTECHFMDENEISFEGFHFPRSVIFDRCTFKCKKLTFDNIIFNDNSSTYFQLKRCQFFADTLSFRNVNFCCSNFLIHQSMFDIDKIDFSLTQFSGTTSKFEQCDFFNSKLNFYKSNFNSSNRVEFSENKLGQIIDFYQSSFKTPFIQFNKNILPTLCLNFKNTHIDTNNFSFEHNQGSSGSFNFNDAQFNGDLSISSCTFNSTVTFENFHFGGAFNCNDNIFERSVVIGFKQDVAIDNCSLSRSIFNGTLSISGKFNEVPDLRNTYIKAHISLSNADITPEFVPKKLRFLPSFLFKQAKNTEDHAKIRRIKEILESNKNHQRALDFHIMEIRTRRWRDGNKFLDHWPEYIFSIFSNYGKSASRPAIWYLVLQVLSTLYIYFASIGKDLPSTDKFLSSMILSISYSISFLSQSKASMTREQDILFDILPTGIKLVSIFNGVTSSILFFLIVLALRNRFRI